MTTSQAPPDSTALQLLRHAEAISALRRRLEQALEEQAQTAADLHDRVTRIEDHRADGLTRSGTSWCWRDLGPQAAEALTRELNAWVTWLRERYSLNRRIPACWDQHPALIEELTALWLAWQAAYTQPDAHLASPAEWHDRWLPGMLNRVDHGATATSCRGRHETPP